MAAGLCVFYLLVFVPLKRKSQSLDTPLQKSWQRLATTLEQTNVSGIDFQRLTNQLAETRVAVSQLEKARQSVMSKLDPGPALRARLNSPFQLLDYQNERSKQQDALIVAAKKSNTTLEAAVFQGYPEHTADIRQPELLWAALSEVDSLLTSAVQSRVTSIHSLQVPLTLSNTPATNTSSRIAEIPVEVEFTASVSAVARFLQVLPLRTEEWRAAGLPNAPAEKPALFLDRIVLKKQTPEKPDEARVWLRVLGFVPRE